MMHPGIKQADSADLAACVGPRRHQQRSCCTLPGMHVYQQ